MTQVQTASDKPRSWKIWIIFFLLALLFHAILFALRLQWSLPTPPPRVEVQNIDPQKLDAIRRQWKEKSLLLDKNPSLPSSKEAPPDARYMSDRNIRVEKEQRARDTQVIPKPGQPNSSVQSESKSAHRPPPRTKAQPHPLPKLGDLGVPFRLDAKPEAPPPEDQTSQSSSSASQGGDQATLDKDLPVGSQNMLNAQESIYYSFYSRLYQAIGPIWQSLIREIPYRRRVNPGEYNTVVDVIFDENGNLKEVHRIQSSGIPEFDNSVDQAWKRVGRFPNPPQGLLDSQRQVHTGWTFSVQVGEGSNFQYLPPARNY